MGQDGRCGAAEPVELQYHQRFISSRGPVDALADLMHDATCLQIDPRNPRVRVDIKQHDDELKAAYDEVTRNAEAKSIFDDAAASYEAHYAAVKQAVYERIHRAMVGKAGSIKALLATVMTKAQVALDLNIGIVSVYRILTEDASCQQGK